ncbi:LysM peptidoglycan-binding domain-containing protein [Paludisphaera soli]|uniref:LysM peptidoglycan-binding domain-containing protein n=1 Tax=Paludisphaera soli TaxID=2712865 RepID=UPI0013EA1CAC|nr:LysM peptidoglycan-binding domain-containing protein [Paludisphaera soli]
MNLARKRHPGGSFSLFSLGLLLAFGTLGRPAFAVDSESSAPSADGAMLGRDDSAPSTQIKVHGTITVDFDKVTIAELLKLVSAIEKVDGVIHIVSSADRDGQPAMVVSGSQDTLTVTKPGSPGDPKLVIDSASKVGAPTFRQVQKVAGPSRPLASEFPRLAALGRLLGVVKHAEDPEASRASRVERIDSAPSRRPSIVSEPVDPSRTLSEPRPLRGVGGPEGSLGLTAGDRFESLASGGPIIDGSIRSPWPAPTAAGPSPEPSRDPQAFRADYTAKSEQNAGPEMHIVSEEETFGALAHRFYGDSRYAWALWWANRDRIAWPDALTPGKSIAVPALGKLDPKMVMTESPTPIGASPAPRRSTPRRDPEMVRASYVEPTPPVQEASGTGGFAVHVVRPEDTLRIIAREKCGDERKALEIIALNRDVLTPEGRPRVGQRLILPSAAVTPAP